MSYHNDMERYRTYIEAHLDERITARDLADLLGYSLYHFCRFFRSMEGISAGAYVRKRRLERASRELMTTDCVTDVALRSGFDTPSGFTRAFRRQYGFTPTEYKKAGGISMTPELKKLDPFAAIGYSLAPPEGEVDVLECGAYWLGKDFSSVSKEEYQKLTYPGYAEIGAWMHPDQNSSDLRYFLGPEVKSTDYVPEGMVMLEFPAAEYAVFTVPPAQGLEALQENIRKTWKYIFSQWFDTSEWKYDESKMDFERYCGEKTCIYVPVIRKER